jgi:hypothetical protein
MVRDAYQMPDRWGNRLFGIPARVAVAAAPLVTTVGAGTDGLSAGQQRPGRVGDEPDLPGEVQALPVQGDGVLGALALAEGQGAEVAQGEGDLALLPSVRRSERLSSSSGRARAVSPRFSTRSSPRLLRARARARGSSCRRARSTAS